MMSRGAFGVVASAELCGSLYGHGSCGWFTFSQVYIQVVYICEDIVVDQPFSIAGLTCHAIKNNNTLRIIVLSFCNDETVATDCTIDYTDGVLGLFCLLYYHGNCMFIQTTVMLVRNISHLHFPMLFSFF